MIWAKELQEWHEFYVLAGTAAATLMALLFVAVSVAPHVVASRPREGVRAFVTPVVTHFAAAFVASAVMLVPGISESILGVLLLFGGLAGLVYLFGIGVHGRWRASKLERDDWIWYVLLPYASYAMVLGAGICLWLHRSLGLDAVCVAVLLQIVAGIRNAWDLILFMVQQQPR